MLKNEKIFYGTDKLQANLVRNIHDTKNIFTHFFIYS